MPSRSVPNTGTEEPVAAIWQRVLGLSTVGLDDNFFELGGNSLLLMHLVVELRSEFRIPLTSVEVLQHPTVRTMRRHLDLTGQGRSTRDAPGQERPRRRFPQVRTHD
jgi:acyl carrier protein